MNKSTKKFELNWDWTPEQKETSKYLFDGKLIKLYYSKNINISDDYFTNVVKDTNEDTLNKITGNNIISKTVLVFPERFMCLASIGGLLKTITNSMVLEEIIILTTTPYLMLEFTTDLVTIIDDYELTEPPTDTLVANMHDIYFKIHDYDLFPVGKEKVNNMLQTINSGKSLTKLEKKIIDLIGENLIKNKMQEQYRRYHKESMEEEIERLTKEIARLEELQELKKKK